MIKISSLTVPLSYDTKMLYDIVAKKLRIDRSKISRVRIAKRSVNTSDMNDIHFDMDLVADIYGDENDIIPLKYDRNVSKEMTFVYSIQKQRNLKYRPVIVGCGPAGMFAALLLAQAGARPILLERGLDVDSRRRKVEAFWSSGVLDTDTNVQFGEGGAGTFSDGKLKIGVKDFRKMKVLREYVAAGAPPEIMYLAKPHIGTDKLGKVVKNIRNKITALGGEIRFGATVTDILKKDGHVTGVGFTCGDEYTELDTDNVVLAIGHSARDTFEKLLDEGVHIVQKPFAVGLRIEHPQKLIDKLRYGSFAGNPALGAADYKMVTHLKNGRAVYTFCMCPGGKVVASSSDKGGIVTNGMSEFARDGENANTALLITVKESDLGSDLPLAGVTYQRNIEKAAFISGGGFYKAPVQRLEDFLARRGTTAFGSVLPTYLPGTEFAEVDSYLPCYIADSLREAVAEMELWMPGYAYPDALLTGAETRSSSPVRIPRGESLEAEGIKGLYPCGEGAGYSGGIISSAVDGLLCAEKILKRKT